MIVQFISNLIDNNAGKSAETLKRLERTVIKGEFREALLLTEALLETENLDELDRVRFLILKSHVLVQVGEYSKAYQKAEQAFITCKDLINHNPLLEVDAVISKANALANSSKLDECLNEIEKGEKLLSTANGITKPETIERTANFHFIKGATYKKKGDLDLALDLLLKSLRINQEQENKPGIADSLNIIGSIYAHKGELDLGLEFYRDSLKIQEKFGDKQAKSKLLNNIGFIYWQKGELDQALDYFHKSLTMFHYLGNRQYVAISLLNIGNINWQRGELNSALDYIKGSLEIFKESENSIGLANAYNNIGNIYKDKGDIGNALLYHFQSLSIREMIGNRQEIATSFNNIGEINYAIGDYEIAIIYLNKSIDLYEELGNDLDTIVPLETIIMVVLDARMSDEAAIYLKRLKKISEKGENDVIDLYYRFASALVKNSSNDTNLINEAFETFKTISTGKVMVFKITVDSMLRQCEVLFNRYTVSNNDNDLNNLRKHLKDIELLAENKEYQGIYLSTILLQGKLETLLLNLEQAKNYFNRVNMQAARLGYDSLYQKSEEELETIKTLELASKMYEDIKEEQIIQQQKVDFIAYLKKVSPMLSM